jgi:hypothetical protein
MRLDSGCQDFCNDLATLHALKGPVFLVHYASKEDTQPLDNEEPLYCC